MNDWKDGFEMMCCFTKLQEASEILIWFRASLYLLCGVLIYCQLQLDLRLKVIISLATR
jgi:hypothetical protein